jgi:hypothetical protein
LDFVDEQVHIHWALSYFKGECMARGFRSSRVWFLTPFGHNWNLNQLIFLQKLSNRQPDHIQPVVIGRWDSCDRSKLVKTQLGLSSVAVGWNQFQLPGSRVVAGIWMSCWRKEAAAWLPTCVGDCTTQKNMFTEM